jgi:DNA-binding NtrC family response regulator
MPVMKEINEPILIVEDSVDTRDILSLALSLENFATKQVRSRDEALRILETNARIHCVLMDWNMPGMNCAAFLIEAKKLRPDLRIILMSAHSQAEELGRQLGIHHFIQKPILLDTLFQAVEECVNAVQCP